MEQEGRRQEVGAGIQITKDSDSLAGPHVTVTIHRYMLTVSPHPPASPA